MTTSLDLTVYIVDDDVSVRDALSLSLSVRGFRTAVFSNANDFLAAWKKSWTGCMLLDIRMPGMDGLTLQRRLLELGCTLPVVVITGHGDVESARSAFRASAVDFLEKPVDIERLLKAIHEAFDADSAARNKVSSREKAARLLGQLTPREGEVKNLVVAGYHNREIAEKLGISVRTVEVHKAHLMSKLGVSSVAELVRMTITET